MVPAKTPAAGHQSKPPGRRKSGGVAYWLLAGSLVLGVAAGVTYWKPALLLPKVGALSTTNTTANADASSGAAPTSDPLSQPEPGANETDLKAREAHLKEREAGVSALLTELTQQKSEGDAIRRAAAMYSVMPPSKAGPLIQALDVQTAVQVLRLLNNEDAGAVVMHMDRAQGAQIMKQFMMPAVDKTRAKE